MIDKTTAKAMPALDATVAPAAPLINPETAPGEEKTQSLTAI